MQTYVNGKPVPHRPFREDEYDPHTRDVGDGIRRLFIVLECDPCAPGDDVTCDEPEDADHVWARVPCRVHGREFHGNMRLWPDPKPPPSEGKHPWEDPAVMPLYHVQVESRDFLVSYEVAGKHSDDAADVAMADLLRRLPEPKPHVWFGSVSEIGYVAAGDPVVLRWDVFAGELPKKEA